MRTRPELFQPRVFLDSSGLISAIITPRERTPLSRMIMLGEQSVIDLRLSREVISDTERFVRRYDAVMLSRLEVIIDTGRMAIVQEPSENAINLCETLTGYRPDARILAAAMECAADVLVTFDKTHLLGNPKIKPPQCGVIVMDAQDCLEWCFAQWQTRR